MATSKKHVASLPPLTLLALVAISIGIFYIFSPSRASKISEQSLEQTSIQKTFIADPIALPAPAKSSRTSLEQALNHRRSRRTFFDRSVNLKQVSQLLWAAQGITTDWGGRTTPSAKSAYPLTVYLVATKVDGLESGIYEYLPGDLEPAHELGTLQLGDFGEQVALAGVQSQFKNAPAVLVITGNMQKMAEAFDGKPNDNNVYLEAGHAAQNIFLQVESLGLGTVTTGGFDRTLTAQLLQLSPSETLIYMMPIGYPEN